jgi:hypothetical protein
MKKFGSLWLKNHTHAIFLYFEVVKVSLKTLYGALYGSHAKNNNFDYLES